MWEVWELFHEPEFFLLDLAALRKWQQLVHAMMQQEGLTLQATHAPTPPAPSSRVVPQGVCWQELLTGKVHQSTMFSSREQVCCTTCMAVRGRDTAILPDRMLPSAPAC